MEIRVTWLSSEGSVAVTIIQCLWKIHENESDFLDLSGINCQIFHIFRCENIDFGFAEIFANYDQFEKNLSE